MGHKKLNSQNYCRPFYRPNYNTTYYPIHCPICSAEDEELLSWFLDPDGLEPIHRTSGETSFIAITSQPEFGWFALPFGYLSNDLVQLQHQQQHKHFSKSCNICFIPNRQVNSGLMLGHNGKCYLGTTSNTASFMRSGVQK